MSNESKVPVLRAMAHNYRNGHSWDHLDGEAVSKAADEIEQLREQLNQEKAAHMRVYDIHQHVSELYHNLRAQLAERDALLGELEWGHYSSPGVYRCLLCGNAQIEGHADNCRMGITLSNSAEPS